MDTPQTIFRGWFSTLGLILVAATLGGCNDETGGQAVSGIQGAVGQQPAAGPLSPSTVAPGAATLSWTAPLENMDGTVLQNLNGFRIYYGKSALDLDNVITVANPSISTYIVENLPAGTWYFGVSAVNRIGIEGPLSTVASKTIG